MWVHVGSASIHATLLSGNISLHCRPVPSSACIEILMTGLVLHGISTSSAMPCRLINVSVVCIALIEGTEGIYMHVNSTSEIAVYRTCYHKA